MGSEMCIRDRASLACPSPRTAVDAIISTTAADPIVQDTAICGTSSVTISASAVNPITWYDAPGGTCLLYTSDAADERSSVDLGGRRIIKQKKQNKKKKKK